MFNLLRGEGEEPGPDPLMLILIKLIPFLNIITFFLNCAILKVFELINFKSFLQFIHSKYNLHIIIKRKTQ